MADRSEIARKKQEERERRERRARESAMKNQVYSAGAGIALSSTLPSVGPPPLAMEARPSSSSTTTSSSASQSAHASSSSSTHRRQHHHTPREQRTGAPKLPTNRAAVEAAASQKLLVNLKYSNDLPVPSGGMKLLHVPLSLQRFAAYKPFSLEQTCQAQILADASEVLPIEVVNPNAYVNAAPPGGLADEDRAILKGNARAAVQRKVARPTVSWMRKTEYISGGGTETLYTRNIKGSHKSNVQLDHADMSINEQLEVIESTFEKANTPLSDLVHPSKPGVTAVKQWHVFPDFTLWENEYCQVSFTDDPAPPTETDGNEEPEQLEELCCGGLVHALRAPNGDNYAVFAVPRINREEFEDLETFEDKETSEKEYRVLREYSMNIPTLEDVREYFLVFDDESGMAVYNPIVKKVELRKRQRDEDSFAGITNERVPLAEIERSEDDEQLRLSRKKALEEEDLSELMADDE